MNVRTGIRLVGSTFLLACVTATAQASTVPSARALRDAHRYALQRERATGGRVSWAVIDTRGRLHTRYGARHHRSASQTKAMLLVAYLRTRRGRAVPRAMRRLLEPMIVVSDNRAASSVYAAVGDARLAALGRAAGMRRLRLNGTWSEVEITAADQARFFRRLDRLLPRRHRRYARRLLSSIVRAQSWGIPAVARRRGYRTFFKGGWRTGLVNQGARLEAPNGRKVAIAVLTDGMSFAAGTGTVAGVARRLLGRRQAATVTRSRPSRLDAYSAPSAARTSATGSVAWTGYEATPALTVTATPGRSAATRRRSRSAAASAPLASMPGSTIANSSPP
jgi:hypothetical protein